MSHSAEQEEISPLGKLKFTKSISLFPTHIPNIFSVLCSFYYLPLGSRILAESIKEYIEARKALIGQLQGHSFLQSGSVLNLCTVNTPRLFEGQFPIHSRAGKKNGNTLPRVGMDWKIRSPRQFAPLGNLSGLGVQIVSGGVFSNTSLLSAVYYYILRVQQTPMVQG